MLASTKLPAASVVAALILDTAFWAAEGFVKPEILNVMGAPPVKVPDIVMVKISPASDALPDAPDGAENATTGDVKAMPVPWSVMTSLPPVGTVVAGVSVTDKVTDEAPAIVLLRVMAG